MRPRRSPSHQWRRRGRKAQASAIATLFGLLLLVTFISNYIIFQLPSQMTQLEFQHLLQVENQLSRLQSTVNAQAQRGGIPLSISSPITLGSPSQPPFGFAATGSISEQSTNLSAGKVPSAGLSLIQRLPIAVNFGVGSGCLGTGNGSCSGSCPPSGYYSYNITASGKPGMMLTISPSIKGTGSVCPTFFNVTGSWDNITLSLQGNNLQQVLLQVNGSHDNVIVAHSGSITSNQNIGVNIYGGFDNYTLSMSGGGVGGSMSVSTRFIGVAFNICPLGTASSTDFVRPAISWGTANNVVQNVTWYNTTGTPNSFSSAGANPGDVFRQSWIVTPYTECPYTFLLNLPFFSNSGLVVHLDNHYLPTAQLALDGGAVVLAENGADSIIVSPPLMTVSLLGNGKVAVHITLINFVGNLSVEGGIATADVQTRLVSTQSFTLNTSSKPSLTLTPIVVSVTTAYPTAWVSFFGSFNHTAFPQGATCVGTVQACQAPPIGTLVSVLAPLFAQVLTLTVAAIAVSIS